MHRVMRGEGVAGSNGKERCSEPEKRSGLRRLAAYLRCYSQDIDSVLAFDPAARSRLEVMLTYPGVHALWFHRASHGLWKRDYKLVARVMSHTARFLTGVEIHPGARIGHGVFIDHGMGVVIGETAHIGDECILYKGVVLGGTSSERMIRHPQLGNRVVVGSNACILGNITIGDGARIGSGSVVVRSVPAGATVVGVPGRIVPTKGDPRAHFDAMLDHANMPDPIARMMRTLRDQNERLLSRLQRLESTLGVQPLAGHEEPASDLGETATPDLPPQDGG